MVCKAYRGFLYIFTGTYFVLGPNFIVLKVFPYVNRHADIPAFWDSIETDADDLLKDTSKLFSHSKHCEISMCYNADPVSGMFTYLLGRAVTHPEDLKNILPDMEQFEIYGLYAIFSTQPVDLYLKDRYIQTIKNTWQDILLWLPYSEFEYDESRKDFEYYDYRDHGWYFDGKRQMDICIPIRQREKAWKNAREKGEKWWRDELKRRA